MESQVLCLVQTGGVIMVRPIILRGRTRKKLKIGKILKTQIANPALNQMTIGFHTIRILAYPYLLYDA